MRNIALLVALTMGAVALEAAIYEEAAAVYIVAPEAPPVDREEVIPESPGHSYVWIRGNWMWHRSWVWEPGHYATLPHDNAVWVPGHWEKRPHGWLWIPGHWA